MNDSPDICEQLLDIDDPNVQPTSVDTLPIIQENNNRGKEGTIMTVFTKKKTSLPKLLLNFSYLTHLAD